VGCAPVPVLASDGFTNAAAQRVKNALYAFPNHGKSFSTGRNAYFEHVNFSKDHYYY